VEIRLKRKNYFIYKATLKNKIIGTISSKLLSSKRGFVTDAYVEPDSRRKGILRKLEKYALDEFKNRGVRIVDIALCCFKELLHLSCVNLKKNEKLVPHGI
jgi:predicted GNAT family acetyltransferase